MPHLIIKEPHKQDNNKAHIEWEIKQNTFGGREKKGLSD
jgi:hypothetical protein